MTKTKDVRPNRTDGMAEESEHVGALAAETSASMGECTQLIVVPRS